MTRQTPTAVTTPVVGGHTSDTANTNSRDDTGGWWSQHVTRQTPTAVTTPVVGGHTSDTANTNNRDDTGGWWSHE